MPDVFNNPHKRTQIALVQDTGVAGATLNVVLYGVHLHFNMQSQHASFSLISNDLEVISELRRGLRKAERLIREQKEYNKKDANRVSNTTAEIRVAESKDTKTGKSKRNPKRTK
jgi:hypothetical protein